MSLPSKVSIKFHLLLLSLVLCANANSVPDPCAIQRKCTTTGPTVYAVASNLCHLFRNNCIYENEICRRRDNYEPALRSVTKDECHQYCPVECTEEYAPLCAEYDGKTQTFSNKCEFLRFSCQNDQSFMFISKGACIPTA